MISNMDANGDTASLKRKREPKDDSALSQKKHRRRPTTSAPPEDTPKASDKEDPRTAALRQDASGLELIDTASGLASSLARERSAPWKLSKPMGGRMLDIDPVFSPDER